MEDRSCLTTELPNERSKGFDRLSSAEAFDVMNLEDQGVAPAVAAAREDIVRAIDLVVAAFQSGGRLIYVGAGTSGRLGVLDATECPPTFLTKPTMVQGVIAGGYDALTRSIEGAEDQPQLGADAMDERNVGANDVVFGIATGGTTRYVHDALRRAKERGAKTVFLACVSRDEVSDEADVSIRVITGPEVLTGSTRLKAGTATKMVLNSVTTIAMARTGRVFGNHMVDLDTRGNAKLLDRGIRTVEDITGLSKEEAGALLAGADGYVKTALVMHFRGADRLTAEALLSEANGFVGQVIES